MHRPLELRPPPPAMARLAGDTGFLALADSLPDAVLRVDARGRVLYANPAAAAASGMAREDIAGSRLGEDDALLDPPARRRWLDEVRAAFETASPREFAFELARPSGRCWYEVRVVPEFGDGGAMEAAVIVCRDVTPQRRAEVRLEESDARLRLVVEQASDILLSVDEEARFRFVSPAMERVLGHVPEALLGTSARELVHPEDWPGAVEILLRAFERRGERHVFRVRLLDTAGRWRHCEAVGRTVDGLLSPGALVVNLRDVSDWVNAQAEREAAQARGRALVEHSHDVVSIVDRGGMIVYQSPSVERVLGFAPHETIGTPAANWVHPDDLHEIALAFEMVSLHPDAAHHVTYRARHRDGGWRTLHATGVDMSHEPAVGGFVINARDITESANAEEQLRWSERRLRALNTAIPIGICETDLAGHLTYSNPRLCELWGQAPEEIMGRGWVARLHPEDRATLVDKFLHAIEAGEEFDAVYRLVMPGGTEKHVHGRVAPIRDDSGAVVGCVGSVVDRTEQQRMQIALADSQRRLRLALDSGHLVAWSAKVDPARPLLDPRNGFPTGVRLIGVHDGHEGGIGPRDGLERLMVVHADDREALAAAVQSSVDTGLDLAKEFRVVTPEGDVQWRHAMARLTWRPDGVPDAFVGMTQDITARKRLETELTWRANHDALTGLANRVWFRDGVSRAMTGPHPPIAVLFIDLDGFKTVNDSLGHQAGDRLLELVAGRLLESTRGAELVARLGGDEFAVLLVGEDARGCAATMASDSVAALSTPFPLNGMDVRLGASIGVASEREGDAPDNVLRNADIALYQAKNAGKGRYKLFVPAMYTAAADRLTLHSDLHRALDADEFLLHYQPILDLASGLTVGAEALVRWHHPVRGLVPPSEFIPALEENGAIVQLGRRVLQLACTEAARWERVSGQAPPVTVNVSTRQLEDAAFPSEVASILRESGLPASRLVIEITESVFMNDLDAMLARLHELKALGLRIAVDDFGTGFSSLAYLQRLPIDVLKIDRAFVQPLADGSNPGRSALARTIIGLAELLGLRTIAEGVETEGQCAELVALGCRAAQGYLFARPLPVDAFVDYLRRTLPIAADGRAADAWRPDRVA